jgi:Zn-dependent protease with chaperone function
VKIKYSIIGSGKFTVNKPNFSTFVFLISSMQFKGIYSDLVIPVKTDSTITLLSDRMQIEIPSANQTREWFYGMIRRGKQDRDGLMLLYKDALRGRLIVNDTQLLSEARQVAPYAPFTQPVPWYQSKNGLYSMFAVKIATIAAAILLFIFGMPYLINFSVDRISTETENSIGKKIQSTLVNPLEVDTSETRLVNEFFSQLTRPDHSHIDIIVINSSVKNAFTFPGGQILIDDGIFSAMNDYPELAAVLGHESGHAINRDPLKMLCRQSATSVLLMSLVGNMNGVINVILNNASYLENLSYSREYESAADHFAYDWMKSNHVNPQGMIDLLNHLEKDNSSLLNVEFISNHPSTQKRIDDIKEWMSHDSSSGYEINPSLQQIWNEIKTHAAEESDSSYHNAL